MKPSAKIKQLIEWEIKLGRPNSYQMRMEMKVNAIIKYLDEQSEQKKEA